MIKANSSPREEIKILPVALLHEHAELVSRLRALGRSLALSSGWHYPLDRVWIAAKMPHLPGAKLLDAGAGIGLMQWYFAGEGASVTSVDRSSRVALPMQFRARYRIHSIRSNELAPVRQLLNPIDHIVSNSVRARWLINSIRGCTHRQVGPFSGGKIMLYTSDLFSLPEIENDTIDAVYSMSSLEHNPPGKLKKIVPELLRVLKPGGVLAATLSASRDNDWFHEPSSGWCYTEATIREVFQLEPDVPSNYGEYDDLFDALRNCDELKKDLSISYFLSGSNGMPWGRWDPKYQPVGVVKVKR